MTDTPMTGTPDTHPETGTDTAGGRATIVTGFAAPSGR